MGTTNWGGGGTINAEQLKKLDEVVPKAGMPTLADFGDNPFVEDTTTGKIYMELGGAIVDIATPEREEVATVAEMTKPKTFYELTAKDGDNDKGLYWTNGAGTANIVGGNTKIQEVATVAEMVNKQTIYKLTAKDGTDEAGYYGVDNAGAMTRICADGLSDADLADKLSTKEGLVTPKQLWEEFKTIDTANFADAGDENTLGLNKGDDTPQKIAEKLEDFKLVIPKAFETVTLATDANLTALKALEPTVTKDDLLFEFKATDGTKSYIVTPLDSFIDLKAIKKIEYKTTDPKETILKITTIEDQESELDLDRFMSKVLADIDVEDKLSTKEGVVTGELLFKAIEKYKVRGEKSWITADADPQSDAQKHALFKGADLYEVMQSMGSIIVAGHTFNIDDLMKDKPTTYTVLVTPNDTTKLEFNGEQWIGDAKYQSGEITLPKQQSILIYNGESWKAKFINSHSIPTKNVDTAEEFYEGKFTTQFINLKMTHTAPKARFYLGANGSTTVHNDGDTDIEIYGYISTSNKVAITDVYTLHSGDTGVFNHMFGDVSFIKLGTDKLQIAKAFQDVGDENDLGLNKDDNTLDKILAKLNSYAPTHEIAGQFVGTSESFAGLTALTAKEADKKGVLQHVTPSAGDYAILNQDEIGTGDVNNPQYPRGYYVTDGAGVYTLKAKMATGEELTVADLKSLDSKKNGLVDGETLNKVFPQRDATSFIGTLDTDLEEVVYNKKTNTFSRKALPSGGVRIEPVADETALKAVPAKDYMRTKVTATVKEYVFFLGGVFDAGRGDIKDDADTGVWIPTVSDSSQAIDFDFQLGNLTHAQPDSELALFEVNGQVITDPKLAEYLTRKPVKGFVVDGNNITLPDWRGRYIGASGGLGIPVEIGALMASTNKRHRHAIATDYKDSGASAQTSDIIGEANSNANNRTRGYSHTRYEGSTYSRGETVSYPICIVGGRSLKVPVLEEDKIAVQVTASFTGGTIDTAKTVKRIWEGVSGFLTRVDLPPNKLLDTAMDNANVTVVDAKDGTLYLQQVKGGGDFTVAIQLIDATSAGQEIIPLNLLGASAEQTYTFAGANARSVRIYASAYSDILSPIEIDLGYLKASGGKVKFGVSSTNDWNNDYDRDETFVFQFEAEYISDTQIKIIPHKSFYIEDEQGGNPKIQDTGTSSNYTLKDMVVEYAIADTGVDMTKYMLKSVYDKNGNGVVDNVDEAEEVTQPEVDDAFDNA